jgi:hypothetical protein
MKIFLPSHKTAFYDAALAPAWIKGAGLRSMERSANPLHFPFLRRPP